MWSDNLLRRFYAERDKRTSTNTPDVHGGFCPCDTHTTTTHTHTHTHTPPHTHTHTHAHTHAHTHTHTHAHTHTHTHTHTLSCRSYFILNLWAATGVIT